MKKYLILSVVLLSAAFYSNAQLMNAKLALDGNDIAVAKKSIDKQMLKPKALTDAESWVTKGRVYEKIYNDTTKAIHSLDTNALSIAIEAYNKAIQFDKPNGQHGTWAKLQLKNMWGVAMNAGADEYNNTKDFKKAIKYMDICQTIMPEDTTAYVYGAYFAMVGGDYPYAKKSYRKLIDLGNRGYPIYKNLYYIATVEDKNDDEAFAVTQEARKEYPLDSYFMANEMNFLIAKGKEGDAIVKLNEAITKDVANAKVYYYNLGILHFKAKDKNVVKAKECFTKSLAIDSLYEGSNFMMGLIYIDEGEVITKKVNNMKYDEYKLKGKKEEAKMNELYKQAIPYLEKAYSVSKEEKVKDQLELLYTRYKMTDKLQKLK